MRESVEIKNILDYEIDSSSIDKICEEIELLMPDEEIEVYKRLKKRCSRKDIEEIQRKVNHIKNTKRFQYFSELFYCLYFNKSYKQCLYVIISSAIKNRIACFKGDTFHVEGVFFPNDLTRYLNGLRTSSENPVTYDLISILHLFLQSELRKNSFCYHLPIVGNINTKKYKMYIRKIDSSIDSNIRNYIHTNNIDKLSCIDPNVGLLKFSISSSKKFKSFYADTQDAVNAAMSIKHGCPRKYKSYYSISGHKYPIE